MKFVYYICIFSILFSDVAFADEVIKAPSYVHTCSVNVPDMNKCILQKAKETLPGILMGDKKLKLPSFLPLRLKGITVDTGRIVFKLLDLDLYGLDSAELTDASIDLKTQHIDGVVNIKEIHVNGTYDVDGQIMILPIKGHGPGYLKFENLQIVAAIDFGTEERNGYHYIIFKYIDIDYTVERASFNFESLFNGDKTLGDQMNKFLNENWDDFHTELKPAIKTMIQTVYLEINQVILRNLPFEALFPGWKPN